jgi:hypothetical protein
LSDLTATLKRLHTLIPSVTSLVQRYMTRPRGCLYGSEPARVPELARIPEMNLHEGLALRVLIRVGRLLRMHKAK